MEASSVTPLELMHILYKGIVYVLYVCSWADIIVSSIHYSVNRWQRNSSYRCMGQRTSALHDYRNSLLIYRWVDPSLLVPRTASSRYLHAKNRKNINSVSLSSECFCWLAQLKGWHEIFNPCILPLISLGNSSGHVCAVKIWNLPSAVKGRQNKKSSSVAIKLAPD